MPEDFTGKTVLITGASKGIGRGIAGAFANANATLILSARSQDALNELAETLRTQTGCNVTTIRADLSQTTDVTALAKQALSTHKRVDILVNNAGVSYPESALETTLESWEQTFAINTRAVFFLSQQLVTPMLEFGWGRIVNVSSQAGLIALKDHAAYCASKGALEMLSKVMALEWAAKGVTVNCIAPTVINTPMAEMAFPTPESKAFMLERIPVGRFGEVADVAAAALFLASEQAGMITGDTIKVDGGWTIQ